MCRMTQPRGLRQSNEGPGRCRCRCCIAVREITIAPIREWGGRRTFLFGPPLDQGSTSPCAVPSFKSSLMPILFCFPPTNIVTFTLPPLQVSYICTSIASAFIVALQKIIWQACHWDRLLCLLVLPFTASLDLSIWKTVLGEACCCIRTQLSSELSSRSVTFGLRTMRYFLFVYCKLLPSFCVADCVFLGQNPFGVPECRASGTTGSPKHH